MANIGYLQIIRRCNQHCLFCSSPANGKSLPLKQALKAIKNFRKLRYHSVILTGGEPTLYPHLTELISAIRTAGMEAKLITNGQRTADPEFLHALIDAGLNSIYLSVHSHLPRVQAYLTNNPDSLKNILKTLMNLRSSNVLTSINQTICAQNNGHIHQAVHWLCERYPFIQHFSWTYLDPAIGRALKNRQLIPTLKKSRSSLLRAMQYLHRTRRTFRIEKVPLCYLGEFGHCSTETRALVKKEERTIRFLDERGIYRERDWTFGYCKGPACNKCSLNSICVGLWDMDRTYSAKELHTSSADPRPLVLKVRADS